MAEGETPSLSKGHIKDTNQRVKDEAEKQSQKDEKNEGLGKINVL
jgi:hypothetical protein